MVYNLGHILDLIKVNEIKDKTYTISFALEQNLTRRGPILAMGVHCSTLLRTPGADLREMFLKQWHVSLDFSFIS